MNASSADRSSNEQAHSGSFERFVPWTIVAVLLLMPWLAASKWTVAVVAACSIMWLIRRQNLSGDRMRSRIDQVEASSRREINRYRADLKSLEAQSRLGASALLQLIDGVVVLSTDLSILLINPSAMDLLSLQKRGPLIGKSFSELVREPKLVKLIRAAIDERHPQEAVFELISGGETLPLRIRADVIGDDGSDKVQLSIRDETEAKQLEGMRREFIANVSHELKTPLAAIKGYAETVQLAAKDDPDMAIHFMNSITTQCLRLERLVSDMMQLARAQSGRAQLNVSSVSLNEIIAESVRTYEPVALAGGLELTYRGGDNRAKVLADPEAMLTIANNLIGNAVRYTPRGGQIDVSIESAPNRWKLIVKDTGVGIAEQDQTKIFERFYRASRNAEMANSSTGLGLAIVKNLTIALGGNVYVQSKPGKGSTFFVEVPAVGGKPDRGGDADSASKPLEPKVAELKATEPKAGEPKAAGQVPTQVQRRDEMQRIQPLDEPVVTVEPATR